MLDASHHSLDFLMLIPDLLFQRGVLDIRWQLILSLLLTCFMESVVTNVLPLIRLVREEFLRVTHEYLVNSLIQIRLPLADLITYFLLLNRVFATNTVV
jgi:hypothetical protein